MLMGSESSETQGSEEQEKCAVRDGDGGRVQHSGGVQVEPYEWVGLDRREKGRVLYPGVGGWPVAQMKSWKSPGLVGTRLGAPFVLRESVMVSSGG